MSQRLGFAHRHLDRLLRPRREGERIRRSIGFAFSRSMDPPTNDVVSNAQGVNRPRGDAISLTNETEHNMLRTDEGVLEVACFILGVDEYSTRSIGEQFEHNSPRRKLPQFETVDRWNSLETRPDSVGRIMQILVEIRGTINET